jgi:signal transduction histidine kinase/ActR/RegA family two-component response regulator
MKPATPRTIRARLLALVLISTTIALFVAGLAMLLLNVQSYRRTLAAEIDTDARILALSTGSALAFDDRAIAERNLRALQARPAVLVAALYRSDGSLFAEYERAGQAAPLRRLSAPVDRTVVEGGRIVLTRHLAQGGEPLGTLLLVARYDVVGALLNYLGIIVAVAVLALVVALLLSQKLQRAVSRPLEAMTQVAGRVIAERDYSSRVAKESDDEIGLVVEAFNRMLDEIQGRTVALERAMQSLRETDRRKDEFLAILAHELRNPLAPIRHAIKLLQLPGMEDRQRNWAREVISRQVSRMALLLDDLLDVSRITSGRVELKKSTVPLQELVTAAVETARPLIETRLHQLDIQLPSERLELEVDALRMSQALSNLLTNAAKYTDEHGQIRLIVAVDANEVSFSVSDTGIGISASALPRLFELFSRGELAVERGETGLGIGLALVKGLVALHGGVVKAESPGPGQGSTFTIKLPRSLVVQGRVARVVSDATPAPMVAQGCNVLIADDNRDIADSLALILSSSGYRVRVAYSGTEAWELAFSGQPEALLLDIGMPGMSGYEIARRVRRESWGRGALLLASTGWGQHEDKAKAFEAGFDYHLTKPVDPDQLLRLVAEFSSQLRQSVGVMS